MYLYPPGPNGPQPYGPYQGGMPSQTAGSGEPPVTQPPLIYAPVTQGFAQSMPLVYLPQGYAAAYGHSPALSWPANQYHWPMGLYQPVPALVSSPPGAVGYLGAPMSRPHNPPAAWPSPLRQGGGPRKANAENPHSRRKPASLSRSVPTSESTTASPHAWDAQEPSTCWQTSSEGDGPQRPPRMFAEHADERQGMTGSSLPQRANPAPPSPVSTHTAVLGKDEEPLAAEPNPQELKTREPCAYFLRTGDCIYGDECRFSHPTERKPALNTDSLPMRPGIPDCRFYTQYRWCAFKKACKFNHPERLVADKRSRCETGHEDLPACMESKYSIGTLDMDTHALKLS